MRKSSERSKKHSGLKGRLTVPPLENSVDELRAWFTTPLGRAILSSQKKILSRELHNLFGYHLLQLSVLPEAKLYAASRINHCFSMSPKEGLDRKKISGIGDYHSLPLPDESIDVCVLHHVLDFSENPQQVLKEAARVTIPNGYIVLLGFNPWSVRGLNKQFMQLFSEKAIWHHHNLRVGRIKDWLNFVDFSSGTANYSFFNLPLNNKKYLRNTRVSSRWTWAEKCPLGASYCLVARKDKLAMTPLKPEWNVKPDIVPAAVAKRAANASQDASGSAMILPLRRRKIINRL